MNQNSVKPGKGQEDQGPVIFEFDGKGTDVQVIDMDLLNRSIRREAGLSGIRGIPIQYWKLHEAVIEMVEAAELNYDKGDIWVQNNSSKAYLTDEEKNEGYTQKRAPIGRWRFDKIISIIHLPNITEGDEEGVGDARNAAIGLTLNKEGLSIAFGINVSACSNFNVMGGTIIKSWGTARNEGLSWEIMKMIIDKWINNVNQIWNIQNEIMSAMKLHPLPEYKIVERVMGDLYMRAQRRAYHRGDPTPFNTYELSHFANQVIEEQKDNPVLANVWDIYNWGTSIMRPGQMDIGEIAINSNMWSDYLVDEFGLDVPKNIFNENEEEAE